MINLKAIFSLLDKRKQRQLILVFLAFVLGGFLEIAGVGSIGPFISIVSNPDIIHTNKYLEAAYNYFNFTQDRSFIIVCGIAVIIVLCVSNISMAGINFMNYYFCGKCRHFLALRFLEKYLRQPYIFFLSTNTASLSDKILAEITGVVNSALLSSLQLLSAAFVSLCIIVLLILLNPVLALLVSLVLLFAYLFIFAVIRKFISRIGREYYVYNVQRYKIINETFGGIKDIKILGKERVFINLFRGASLKSAMANAFSEIANEMPRFLIETVALSGIILVVIFMLKGGNSIDQFLPTLTIYAFGAYRLLPSLQKMYRGISTIKYSSHIIDNLYKDLHELSDGEQLPDTHTIPVLPFNDTISLEHISFAYPNTEKDVIKDQSFVIKHNSSIALVGPTGCGKTTLVDVLLGLLKPQQGRIFADSVEITESNMKNWQQNFGYVPQHIFLTDDTVRNNIAFGIPPDKISDEAVMKAAKLANIHDFVTEELKEGYNTIIGERGVRLSGGQRQRIGIARAIYHDPAILILDEATSALDSMTESAIMDAIGNLNSKKTIIMIAHRLTTVKNCDIIYMMDKGKITDSGSYGDLYARNTLFRRLADGGKV